MAYAAAAALAGCAAPSQAGAGRPAGGCPTPGITEDEVRLGMLLPDSGNAESLFSPFRAGVDARLGVANAAGGVHGRQVRYDWEDDGSEPERNLVGAGALVNRPVFAILESTSVASGSAAFLHSQGIPVLGTSLEDPWTRYDNMFSYSNLLGHTGAVSTYGDFVVEHGGQRAVMVVTQFSRTSQDFAEVLTASLRARGIPVVATVDATAPVNFGALGRQIKESGADVMVGAVTGGAFGQAVLAALGAQANLKVILSPTGYDQRLLDTFKQIIAGVYLVVDFTPFEADRPAHKGFLTAMARYAPETRPANQQAALSGWISADMLLRGLQAAGTCPTREGFIKALRAVRGYTADGLLPQPIDFRADFGKLTRCLSFVQVAPDGKRFDLVDPLPRCGEEVPR
ncbi:ABC transporter substrate-binding protein [Frankia sp. CNm7]|uniref:ABC transporter substrate-binding protein n=1 Tax=Frankia nepalensis TaxID=1836974 RepID=A0A937RRG8_9ACTN|nr:ABC transporter substrate-binding protein [Frankia nepalensis]MBL7514259.1 ABC transporter substrate-binding protein [Frankia nepalensis]MBL7518818.1 ABC transporter substrate-binding protein [Frankia nepalensis]MBL7632004.1 ABC transporter substrate-binding protein [Frankia nepalensis]